MSDALTLAPGTRVDSLRIDRVLGQGAFGVTYLVTDTVLDESFALKEYLPRDLARRGKGPVLAPVDAEAEAPFAHGLKRFLAEGRTLARLDHPAVVRVVRCFEANGTAYLQMSWYRGEALHKLLKRGGTLDREEALALARPLLDALAYIHGHGVIHQDIKPANIYITQDGKPVLLDFGAADGPSGEKQGSEGYAAPEQSEAGASVTAQTDIYGLAATIYRCISGHLPPAARQRKQAVESGQPDPLLPLGQLVPAAEFGALTRAVETGLALDPVARPRSIADWQREFGGDRSISSHKPVVESQPEEKEWLPVILLGVFIAVLAAALIYLFLPGDESASETRPGMTSENRMPERSPEEEARWRAALSADTAYGYQQFLLEYPESIHSDQAHVHLERLDHQAWGRTSMEGTRAAIEAYLEQFPEGLHRADADILLNEIRLAEEAEQRRLDKAQRLDEAAWEEARKTRTLAAVDAYLAAWPGGLHESEARDLRAQIQGGINDRRAYQAAQKLNNKQAYQSYIDAFPRGANVAAALEAIDNLTLRPGKAFRDCPDCPSMMVIPAGSFWQGSDPDAPLALKKETPRRMVTLAEPFAISVFEITFEQWDRCVADGGCSSRPGDNGWGRASRPVIMVSWNDAQEYVAWLSKRTGQSYSLPSESQWEYAARAGEESDWQGGNPALVCQFANVAGSESGFRWQHADCADAVAIKTLPVGSLRPNAFGLYDTIGNVSEWTLDCMNLSYLDAPADGSAWSRGICSSRMTRGGSWFTGTREIRLSARFNLKNGDRNDFTGFRVARKITE
ncbi:MAG: bifunctional serine/threonine-protein kinase/formylglycine-generating enzyme family protein [Xanthomonadales bacterium]|jgi:formylglycine-generating enzyme required for sulfatase activity/serine/threonine protein kinase|nr:bifunctional serine/threonine-protein kinase/formylglycine-generating enzyme family protein [Xanthomonadales bacterium]